MYWVDTIAIRGVWLLMLTHPVKIGMHRKNCVVQFLCTHLLNSNKLWTFGLIANMRRARFERKKRFECSKKRLEETKKTPSLVATLTFEMSTGTSYHWFIHSNGPYVGTLYTAELHENKSLVLFLLVWAVCVRRLFSYLMLNTQTYCLTAATQFTISICDCRRSGARNRHETDMTNNCYILHCL